MEGKLKPFQEQDFVFNNEFQKNKKAKKKRAPPVKPYNNNNQR